MDTSGQEMISGQRVEKIKGKGKQRISSRFFRTHVPSSMREWEGASDSLV